MSNFYKILVISISSVFIGCSINSPLNINGQGNKDNTNDNKRTPVDLLDGSWHSTSNIESLNTTVWGIANLNNTIYVGGDFTTAGSTPTSRIAKWNGTKWDPLGSGIVGNDCTALSSWQDNLYVGGNYTSSGTATSKNLSYWDGSLWHSFGNDFFGGPVDKIIPHKGNLLVLGRTYDAISAPSVLAKWTSSGFVTLGTLNSWAVTAYSDKDNVYIGGRFTSVNGITAKGIARWDGHDWHAMGTGLGADGEYNDVMSIVKYNNHIVAGGEIYHTGDGATTLQHIAVWNGVSWSMFSGGITQGVKIVSMVTIDNNLIIGGQFTEINNIPAQNIAWWDGSSWNAFGSGANGQVNAIFTLNNSIWIGGGFTTINGISSSYASYWTQNSPLAPSANN